MIKALGFILTVLGIIGLILGVTGLFGPNLVYMSPLALAILGFIFFIAGIGLLKRRRDTDEVTVVRRDVVRRDIDDVPDRTPR